MTRPIITHEKQGDGLGQSSIGHCKDKCQPTVNLTKKVCRRESDQICSFEFLSTNNTTCRNKKSDRKITVLAVQFYQCVRFLFVLPAQAGIETKGVNPVFLGSRLIGNGRLFSLTQAQSSQNKIRIVPLRASCLWEKHHKNFALAPFDENPYHLPPIGF